MGLNKDFFTKPIIVPCTLSKTVVNEDGSVSTTEEKMIFSLRREKQGEADSLAKEAILNTASEREIRLTRFAGLLTVEPTGFDDFPRDERPLAERANEYYNDDCFDVLIRSVMVYYDRAAYPAELFRGF